MPANPVIYRPARAPEIHAIRERTLLPGTERTSPVFPGDELESTLHFGAFLGGEGLACATFLSSEWEGEPAWQLRGMGVVPEARGQGIGQRLLGEAYRHLTQLPPVPWLWCNSRERAIRFYERLGWRVVSGFFVIPEVGQHVKMILGFPSGQDVLVIP